VSRRRLVWLALAGVFLAGAIYILYVSWRAELVVFDAKANRVLLRTPVRPGDSFTLSYIHSVAKSRVTGAFEVTPAYEISVRETTFGSFGPGLPDVRPGDDYQVKDGLIRLKVNQTIPGPGLVFAVYPYTEHRLQVGDRTLDLSREVEAGGRVAITLRPPITHWGSKSP
jgi:hypothetical protein